MTVTEVAAPSRQDVTRRGYAFIDQVRFVAIALIALGHSNVVLGQQLNDQPFSASVAFYSLQKFDIICMYLVSGFLMGDAVNRSRSYVFRRAERTAVPWAVWVGISLLLGLPGLLGQGDVLVRLGQRLWDIVFYSPYWFIPNYLFGLMFMFFVLRYIPMKVSGILLGLGSLIYGANLYGEWFRTEHTVAWFGFMFYLWLGARAKQHWPRVEAALRQVRWEFVLGAVAITGAMVVGETALLLALGSDDASNALKFSNHLYSVVWCVLLIVLPWRIVPSFIDSRRESFGVYLTHPVILAVINQVTGPLGLTTVGQPQWVQILAWVTIGVVSYLLALVLVKGVTRLGYGRMVGDL